MELNDLILCYSKAQLHPSADRQYLAENLKILKRLKVSPIYRMRLNQLMLLYLRHQRAYNLCRFNLRNWCNATIELKRIYNISDPK